MVQVRWTGAAGLEITHEGKTWLVDPYYSRWGKWKIFFGRVNPRIDRIDQRLAELPGDLQAVMVGHTHFDHALDIPPIAHRFDGPVVGSASLDALLRSCGQPDRVTVCRGGERLTLPGDAAVTMLESRHVSGFLGKTPFSGEIEAADHPPVKAAHYLQGCNFICLLEVGGVTFAHSGSANLLDEALVGRTCDVLFMAQPFWKNTRDYHRRLVGTLKPRVVVPFHFDDFTKPLTRDDRAPVLPLLGTAEFMAKLREAAGDAEIIVPETYETMEF